MNTRSKGTKVPPTGRGQGTTSSRGGKAKPGSRRSGSTTVASSSRSTPAPAEDSQTSSRKRKTPDGMVTLSPAEFAQYQKFLSSGSKTPSASQSKTQAQARKAARDKEIHERNQAMLNANVPTDTEDNEDLEEEPAAKRNKTAAAHLDEEEQALALDLSANIHLDDEEQGVGEDDDDDDDDEDSAPNNGEERGAGAQDGNASDGVEQDDNDFFATNGLQVKHSAPLHHKMFNPQVRQGRGQGKIKHQDLGPRTDVLSLATAGKSAVKSAILFGDWDEGRAHRFEWAWTKLKELEVANPAHGHAIKHLEKLPELKERLLTYILYAKGSVLNALISKARVIVPGIYSLSGKKDEIAARVEWLQEDSHFLFAGIDVEAQAYQRGKPFGSPVIKQLLDNIIFKSNNHATARLIQQQQEVPLFAVLLSVVAAEHAIGEYTKGYNNKQPFEEKNIRSRYNYHEENFKALKSRHEAWGAGYCKAVYRAIAESNGFDELDKSTGEDMNAVTEEDLAEGMLTGPF